MTVGYPPAQTTAIYNPPRMKKQGSAPWSSGFFDTVSFRTPSWGVRSALDRQPGGAFSPRTVPGSHYKAVCEEVPLGPVCSFWVDLSLPRLDFRQTHGEFLDRSRRKIKARKFPAVSFEMKADSPSAFVIPQPDQQLDRLYK